MYFFRPLRGKTVSVLIKQVLPLLDVFDLPHAHMKPSIKLAVDSQLVPLIFRSREGSRPAPALESSTAPCLGKQGFSRDSDTGTAATTAVPHWVTVRGAGIPPWRQAGIAQLLWELWLIHSARPRLAQQASKGSQVTGHCCLRPVALFSGTVQVTGCPHWPQQCRLKPGCPAGLSTNGAAWHQHFVLLLQSHKQPFTFGSCTCTMASTGRQNPCMF